MVVSTGVFISFLAEASFGVVDVEKHLVRALGGWENKITATSVEDIGKVISEIVYSAPEVKGVVHIAGDTLKYADIARIIDSVLGHTVGRELWSIEKLKLDLIQDPKSGMKKYWVVIAEGKGVAWNPEQTFNIERGLNLQSFKTWLMRQS